MKDFARALQQAWRHWPVLSVALLCSFAVAALWGANIAALFPIIETTLHGQSLQEWNQKRLKTANDSLTKHEEELKQLEEKRARTENVVEKRDLGFQLDMLNTQIKVDRAGVYSAEAFSNQSLW